MKIIKWSIDPVQSEIAFKVRKLLVTTITGKFEAFKGELETESENFKKLRNIQFEAKIDSVKTDDQERDEHLKSADFFEMDSYPYLKFSAKEFNTADSKLEGELTIRNITKPVTLDVEFLGAFSGKNKKTNAGVVLSGKVKRQDFGLIWNGKNQAGEIIVGDEINLKAQVYFTKQDAIVEAAQETLV